MARSPHDKIPDEPVALVLQGGGALGAYQAGVYESLDAEGYRPDWVAGISIGAVNAAIIAGNEPERRVDRLREFWDRLSQSLTVESPAKSGPLRRSYNEISAAFTALAGVPGFFTPRMPPPFAAFSGTPGATSFYDTAPLRDSLIEFVDFDLLNSGKVRLSVGAVSVLSGNFAYFDTTRRRIEPEHIMASGALPPGFPPVMIDGEPYWDGGLVSNTPLQYILDGRPRGDITVFQVDLFSARGRMPKTITEVYQREKDIRYSSRTRLNTDMEREMVKLRDAAARIVAKLPPELREDPDAKLLARCRRDGAVTVMHLINRGEDFDSQSKDYEFSRMTVNDHWSAGRTDAQRSLGHPDWLNRKEHRTGMVTYDLVSPGGPRVISV